MGLKAVLDSLEGLDAGLHSLYIKGADGKYKLDAEGFEDTSGLKSALEKERKNAQDAEKARKQLEDEYKTKYKDIDPDKIKALMAKFENDEESKLIAEGKIDEVVSKRTERMRTGMAAEQEKAIKEAEAKVKAAEERANKFSQRVLDNHIRAAAAKVGLHPQAIEDALFRGRNMFSLDENGDAVQLNDGKPVFGKDGKTPFNPAEWLEGMKETAPHWFPNGNSGGGSGGNNPGAGNGKTMKRAAFEQMAPADKQKYMQDGGTLVD